MKKICFVLIIALLSACGAHDDDDLSKELSEAIEKDQYTPHECSLLTTEQIQYYIRIRALQRDILKADLNRATQKTNHVDQKGKEEINISIQDYINAFRALGESGEHLSIYLTSAKKLGLNSKEYQWVKNTIFETLRAHWADSASIATIKAYQNMLKNLYHQEKETPNLQTQNLITQQIRLLTKSLEYIQNKHTPLDETELLNLQLMKKYIPQIVKLKSDINELHQKLELANFE